MANKKNTNANMPSSLKSAFSELGKMNEYSSVLSDNAISTVKEFIDSGCMGLNAIMSGSLYGGVPKGRITIFAGPTGSGKSLILNKIIASAQRKDSSVWGVVWDSENAYDPQMARNMGANPDQIMVNPVLTIEECRNQIVKFLDKIVDDESLYGKIVICIDSLGNLASAKEIADAEAGKHAVDMGQRAKAIRSLFRAVAMKCAATDTTLLIANHVYDDPSSMYPSSIKSQSGGQGPLYMATVMVQLAVSREKIDKSIDKETINMGNSINGVKLRAMTTKNRIIPEGATTTMFLNFKNGLYKYSGLLEMAEEQGIIIRVGNSYELPDGTKLGTKRKFKNDDKVWEDHILPKLEETLGATVKFKSDYEDLKGEVENIKEENDED